MDSGESYLKRDLIEALHISQEYVETEALKQIQEIKAKSSAYPLRFRQITSDIKGKIIVLIDDGAASGATLTVALRYIKKYSPGYTIVGIPVAPEQTVSLLENEADNVKCIFQPRNVKFRFVEDYYVDYSQVTDEKVAEAIGTINQNV